MIPMKRFFILVSICFSALQACKDEAQELRPQKRTVIEAVYASAILSPLEEYELIALGEGQLLECYVAEGENVSSGQPLFQIRSEVQQTRLQAAADAVALARSNATKQSAYLQEQAAMVDNTKARYVNDSVRWERYRQLAKSDIGTKMDYDKAELAFQTSKNDWLNAISRFNRTQDQLKQERLQAEAAYTVAQEEMRNYNIRADRNAMIYEIFKEKGEMVRRGELLAVLGGSTATQLKLKVDEADIQKIKVGQLVIVRLDILPDSIFEAKVTQIYPRLNRKEQAFTVDAAFIVEPNLKLSGLNAEANIIIQKREAVLTIPKSLLQNDSVWVKEGGEEKLRKLKTGVSDNEWIEVISGIDENTVLIQQ